LNQEQQQHWLERRPDKSIKNLFPPLPVSSDTLKKTLKRLCLLIESRAKATLVKKGIRLEPQNCQSQNQSIPPIIFQNVSISKIGPE